ncbi:MAG: cysteine hydrolase [Hyphomicrobiales bacterium]|nr:MAG: cysteine hydrolase [Hyphomicrobiales bacterium]
MRASGIVPLTTLERKIAPAHTAVIVVDMMNAFCSRDGHAANSGRNIDECEIVAGVLPPFLAAARDAGVLVIFVRNVYSTDANFYLSDVWLEHADRRRGGHGSRTPICEPGSWSGEFFGDVQPQDDDPIVVKHRYSAFHNTDLETVLRANGIRTIVLTGVVTNVCVETTAREGYVRDYYVVVPEDGTGAYSPEDKAASLRNIDRFFGMVSSMEELTGIWSGKPALAKSA